MSRNGSVNDWDLNIKINQNYIAKTNPYTHFLNKKTKYFPQNNTS